MWKNSLLYFFSCLCPFLGQGQSLIWEKKIPLSTYESFSCITKTSNGDYLALGRSSKWMIFNPVRDGAFLMKFNSSGDTLWTKWTGFYGGFNKVISDGNGLFYALMAYQEVTTNTNKWGLYFFNEEGQGGIIPIANTQNCTLLDMEFRHGYIWISGQKTPSLFYPAIAGSFDFLLMKLRPDGSEVFSLVYNANEPASRGRTMEFMPNGNILFSGSAGTKIGAFEIDTAGNQVQYRTYFTNPLNGGWQGAVVNQVADGNRMVGGYRSTNPVSYYLGKHDTSGARIWGGIKPGAIAKVLPNQDNSTVITYSDNSSNTYISRIRGDSTYLWLVNIFGTSVQGYKYPNDVVYEQDESGVVVGSISPASFNYENLYIAKFGGLGVPYNPTSAKALESMKSDAEPLAFPNPGADVVKFTMLAGPGKVSFSDMQGRKVYDGEYLPEKGVDTKALPQGLYTYRLERNGKVWVGNWVKE